MAKRGRPKKNVVVKEETEEPVKAESIVVTGKVAKVDINLQYRKGDTVPIELVHRWDSMGLNTSDFFD